MEIKIKTVDAIAEYGNKNRLANALKISRQAVQKWGEYLPETSAYKLYILRQLRWEKEQTQSDAKRNVRA